MFWPEKDQKSRVTVPLKVKKNVDSRESDIADFFYSSINSTVLYSMFICKKKLPENYGRVAVNFFHTEQNDRQFILFPILKFQLTLFTNFACVEKTKIRCLN